MLKLEACFAVCHFAAGKILLLKLEALIINKDTKL